MSGGSSAKDGGDGANDASVLDESGSESLDGDGPDVAMATASARHSTALLDTPSPPPPHHIHHHHHHHHQQQQQQQHQQQQQQQISNMAAALANSLPHHSNQVKI